MKCQYCSREFTPAAHNSRYCSLQCKRQTENAARRNKRATSASTSMLPAHRSAPAPKDQRVFFVPDVHIGYQDPVCWQLCLKAVQEFQPTTLVVLGDFLDCEGVSKYPSNPVSSSGSRLQRDVDTGILMLRELQDASAGVARRIFLEGNHELRISKWTMERAPQLYGLKGLEVHEMLKLNDFGYEFYRYDEPAEVMPGFITIHGKMISKDAGQSAAKEAQRWGMSGASGHTHRLATYRQKVYDQYRFWLECGYLGTFEVPGADAASNWQNGFATVVVDDGIPWPETHEIRNGRVRFHGTMLKA